MRLRMMRLRMMRMMLKLIVIGTAIGMPKVTDDVD